MAGKTVADKLLIRPGSRLWAWPSEHGALLGEVPDGVTHATSLRDADTAVLFAPTAASLEATLADHAADLGTPVALWIAYPKAGQSDLKRDTLWPMLRPYGLRPISQIAIDDVWSALRFRQLAPGETFDP